VRWISDRSSSHTWWSLIVNKRDGALKNLLSSTAHTIAIFTTVMILMATAVATTTTTLTSSWAILLNNNNNNIAHKIPGNYITKVSHKSDRVVARSENNNNDNIKLKSSVSTKKKFTPKLAGRGGDTVKKFNIALIKPTFTAAAYDNSFYKFYILFSHIPAVTNVTTHLNLLSNKVPKQLTPSSSALSMSFLSHHLKLLLPKSTIGVLNDADVDRGSIFLENGIINNNKYDVLIIGHQEYVTQREYDNLKQFVANGGTLIVLDGNVFYAQVRYDRNTDFVTLVKGHGWTFNGKSAWKSVNERWKKETSDWLGSNYLCYSCKITFLDNPFGYKHHEEQYITNTRAKILMNYEAKVITSNKKTRISQVPIAKPVIATYQLNYQRGKVIVLGIYSSDIISNSKFNKFFDGLLLQQAI
jgi:N,N-dimethylformamidase beta subunit-like protein